MEGVVAVRQNLHTPSFFGGLLNQFIKLHLYFINLVYQTWAGSYRVNIPSEVVFGTFKFSVQRGAEPPFIYVY